MPMWVIFNDDGIPAVHELKNDELVLALASLKRRSFIRLAAGADLVLRTERNEPKEVA
jgi:hypothetical protein